MNQFVDEGKLKELKKIISLEEENLPKLIQFEKENASRFYYTKLVQESEESSLTISRAKVAKFHELIQKSKEISNLIKRIKEVEFHEKEEKNIRNFIQSISSQTVGETDVESEVVKFIHCYLKLSPFNVEIFTIMIDEISKSNTNNAFEIVLYLVKALESRETILEIYKMSIQELTKSLDSSSFLFLQNILDSTHVLGYNEKFTHFYPNFKASLVEAPFSKGYSEFIINNIQLIPKEELKKIFHYLANEFKNIKKRESMLDFLLKILDPDFNYWASLLSYDYTHSYVTEEYFFLF
jgi:hypothetical protein